MSIVRGSGLGGLTEDAGIMQGQRDSKGKIAFSIVVEKNKNQRTYFRAILPYFSKCRIFIKAHIFFSVCF